MTHSMTGFARRDAQSDTGALTWEIRSVNHKYLDIHLRLPEELRELESGCRELIGKHLNRGRIDAQLKFDRTLTGETVSVDLDSLNAVRDSLKQIEILAPGLDPCRSIDILKWPGVMRETPINMEELQKVTISTLDTTLSGLVSQRQREGQRMEDAIRERVAGCRSLVADLKAQLPDIEYSIQARWQDRLAQLNAEIDEARLHQELAILLTRTDISEELDRLNSHFDEVAAILDSEKPAGRRLDFLMQELNREANTLGSKSADARNTRTSMELKVLIDQMREQVQNIE
ncbi:MAG: YicC/YloC family endoribonuclease [Pseudomonadota bacterium]